MPDKAGLKRGYKNLSMPGKGRSKDNSPDIDHKGRGKSSQGLGKRAKFVKSDKTKNVNKQARGNRGR